MESPTLSLSELEQFDSRARATGKERRFCCPLCGGEKPMDAAHRSLCVNTESGAWNCKRCGASGKLREYWEDKSAPIVTGKTRRLARAQRMLEGTPRQNPEPNPDSVVGFKRQIKGVKPLVGSPAETYLLSRGIPPTLAKSAHCKYAPSWGKIGAAVVFPVRNESGTVIAAAGRAVEGSGKQTFGPKSLGVFVTPGALDADPVAITEAPIDALSLALAQIPAIALCGTSGLPSWLVTRLAKPAAPGKSRTVYLAFDADPAGDTAAAKIETQLSLVHCPRLRPQSDKDWNAILTTQGPDSLRQMPEITRLPAKTTKHPTSTENPQESANTAVLWGKCSACGGDVVLHPFEGSGGWYWYECEGCGEAGTVEVDTLKM